MADSKYFAGYFPKIEYQGRQITDLTRRSVFFREFKDNQVLVGTYRVKDGETAWSLATDFYNDPDYYWIITHLNDTVDPFFRWCLSQPELERLCDFRYGEDKYEIAYWIINGRKFLTDQGDPNASPVTNYQHEEILNEGRRRVKILRPEFLGRVVREFEKSIKGRRVS